MQECLDIKLTYEEEEESLVVGMPHTVVDPWAMVILQAMRFIENVVQCTDSRCRTELCGWRDCELQLAIDCGYGTWLWGHAVKYRRAY